MSSEDHDRLQRHVDSIAYDIDNPTEADWYKEWMENNEEEGEPSAFDYIQDALDIQYIVSHDKAYLGARILVAFGGPNIWIDTRTKTVEGYWWMQKAFADYWDDPMDLDDACAELYHLD